MSISICKLTLLQLLVVLPLCGRQSPPAGEGRRPGEGLSGSYTWKQLTPEAGYAKSYNYQLFSDGDIVRAFHHDGVWFSRDGVSWQKTALPDIVNRQAFLDYVRFKGAIYALGTFDGNIERYTQTTQIARTSDYKSWEILAKESTLPKRFFYHPFVFQDKIWIIGGEDAAGEYDDAWVSSDAVHWTKIADRLPFGKRAGQQFVLFKDKLYMLGSDAWVSSDGLHWELLTPKIAEGNIFGYSVEVFDGRIWLIGCNRNGIFRSEVLTSADGVKWIPQRAPWTPRGGVATCIFRNQIMMTGGKYGGPGIAGQTEFVYSNDVWVLRRP
ncbi:MAG TPA: hypothetical protein VI215_05740 [Bacteroidota bacterium]|jgi:hypothetical protein